MTSRQSGETRDERFEAAYRKYYGHVYRYFRSCRVADDEAHDLAQDTFKRFYERMDQLRGDDAGPFVQSIARSILLNSIRARETTKRKAATVVHLDDPEVHYELEAVAGPDYAERQEQEQRRNKLREGIAQLSDTQRSCMELWLEGHQYDEIARTLEISMDAVKTRIKVAKKTLSAQLGEKIPEDDE